MADAYIEDDYNPKKRNRRPRKRPRWPFVILGFLIGFITLPALISLTVLLIVNRPVEKTVNTIDKITNVGLYEMLFGTEGENGEDGKLGYLDDRYGEMKLKDALGDIVDIAQKGNQLTFNDLATISPQVEKAVDELVQAAEEKSIILDKMELMATPLSGFSDLLMDEVKEIQLGEVLLAVKPDIFEDESTGAILKNLFFGRAEINYTESDGVIEMLPITYTYDDQTDTFVCVDETVYKYNGEVWETEDGGYISKSGDAFAFYSSYGDLLYQLQPSENKSMTFYTAVTVNSEGIIEYVKQQSLALGSFMGGGDPMAIIGKLELGVLLGINSQEAAESDNNNMLVALAYGTYGVDYTFENGKVTPVLGGKDFTTLGDLMGSPDEVLNNVQLGAMLGIKTRTDAEKDGNEMLVALAYGTYGVDFEYDINGNIIAKDGGKDFTTLGELINHSDQILDGIQLGALLGIKTRADVDSGEHDMMIAIAYGTYDVDFEYDADDNIIPKAGGEPFTTLGELLDSPDAVLQGVQVGALLGITTKEDVEKSDSLMVSLAYGTYDVDFEYDSNNKIVAKAGGKPFTTVATLMDPDEVNTILEDIPLSTIFTVDIFDPNADALTVSLIYGTAGKHYVIAEENGEKYIDWQIDPDTGAPYSERTFGDIRKGNLTEFVNDLKVGDVFELTATSPKLLVAIQDWYVSDLGKQEKINSLQLKDVIDVGTEGVLAEMGEWQIGEISESKIKSIKLSSVLNVNAGDTGLIASLANKKDDAGNPWTIGHLTEANVQNLTVGEVLPSALGADAETDFFAALKDAKIGDLNATYIKEQLTIGQVLGIKTTDEGILATFANYKVGDFTEGALKSELTIGDVIDADAHPILGKLASTPLDQVDNAAIENALNDLQLSEVIEIDHPLFKYMATKKLGEIDATFIDGIKVKDALGIESTTDPILTQIMDLKLGDLKDSTLLKDKITNLQLNQLLEVSGIPVLEQLGSYKLNELDEETINELKICEILGIEDPDSDFYFKHLKTSTIGTMVSDIDNLTVVQLFEDTMEYDEHGNIAGTWKYLLTHNRDESVENPPNKDYVAPDKYKVSDMAAMIENMHNNIEEATLWDLHDDKLAAHLDEDTLDSPLVYKIVGVSFKTDIEQLLGKTITDADNDGEIDDMTVGDLDVLQVAEYLSLVLDAIHDTI